MDVILLRDVEKVGLRGDVVSVSRGYMRNYLQPRRLAEEATPARLAEIRKREELRSRQEARSFEQAQEIAARLEEAILRFEANAGPRGTLFGSVTATDVADELWQAHRIRVDRRKIELPDPIKRIGRYHIPIDLFQDVRVEVTALVAPADGGVSDEELPEGGVPADEAPVPQAPAEGELAPEAEAEAGPETQVEPAPEAEAEAGPETQGEAAPEAEGEAEGEAGDDAARDERVQPDAAAS